MAPAYNFSVVLTRFDNRPLARVGEDGVVRLLSIRGCGLERLPKHESGIFTPQGWRSPRMAKVSTALASWDKKCRPGTAELDPVCDNDYF